MTLTCDSDEVIEQVFYCDKLPAEGLKELWVKAGFVKPGVCTYSYPSTKHWSWA